MASDETVTFRERLWSQECEQADPDPEDKTDYLFSNGRKFERPV